MNGTMNIIWVIKVYVISLVLVKTILKTSAEDSVWKHNVKFALILPLQFTKNSYIILVAHLNSKEFQWAAYETFQTKSQFVNWNIQLDNTVKPVIKLLSETSYFCASSWQS